DAVRAALDALPEPDREVLRLRFLEAMDWGAIGRQLGVTPDAARVRASRVLLRLRDLLSGEGTGEHAPDEPPAWAGAGAPARGYSASERPRRGMARSRSQPRVTRASSSRT